MSQNIWIPSLTYVDASCWFPKWQSRRPLCCTGAPIGAPTSTPELTTAHSGDNPAHSVYKIGLTPSYSTTPGPSELAPQDRF
eukprot:2543403-Ditylum_brightwellii.AAC.1